MMKYVNNERGNSIFYILWLFGIVAVLLLIIVNISKIFVVQAQANSAVEQAALAGSSVLIEETTKAIEEFDDDVALSAIQKGLDGGKSIQEQVEKRQQELENDGISSDIAYINALNDVLPEKFNKHPLFKKAFRDYFANNNINYLAKQSILTVLSDNKGSVENAEIVFSTSKYRFEIKSTTPFESVSDNKLISSFKSDVPQKGYGPKLTFLKGIYTFYEPF